MSLWLILAALPTLKMSHFQKGKQLYYHWIYNSLAPSLFILLKSVKAETKPTWLVRKVKKCFSHPWIGICLAALTNVWPFKAKKIIDWTDLYQKSSMLSERYVKIMLEIAHVFLWFFLQDQGSWDPNIYELWIFLFV